MTCCGNIVETTDQDDAERVFLCQLCGKQGPGRAFPDPLEQPPELPGRVARARLRVAEALDRLANFIAPE